jgi:uncharacterized membrane protein required for colicin V production
MFEAIVGLVVLLGILLGARKGFVRQSAALGSMAFAATAAMPLSRRFAPLLDLDPPLNRWLAFGTIILLGSLILYVLAGRIRKLLERAHLGSWDGFLGGAVGALKGFAAATTLTLVVLAWHGNLRDVIARTVPGRLMQQSLASTDPLWPPEVRPLVHPYVHYLDQLPSTGTSTAPN